MADWLHCNTCFKQPGDGRGYFLTSCGHIYCECCQNKGWQERCLLCQTEKPSSIQLTSKLKPPYDVYMTDPSVFIKQIDKLTKHLIMNLPIPYINQASDFQSRHRRRYVYWLQKRVASQEQIVEQQKEAQFSKLKKQYEDIVRENSKLKEESIYLKRVMNEKRNETKARGSVLYDNKGQCSPAGYFNVTNNNSTRPYNYQTGYQPGPNAIKSMVTPGRISVRTPPSGGRLGSIPQGTPSPLQRYNTPKSVPHPIGFDARLTPQ